MRARWAFLAGLGVTVAAICVVLTRSPLDVTRTAPMLDATKIGTSDVRSRICQAGETLPSDTTAIRVLAEAVIGPAASVQALAGGRVLASGRTSAGWTAGALTIPVTRVTHRWSPVTICIELAQSREQVGLQVVDTAPARAAVDRQGPIAAAATQTGASYRQGPLPGRLLVEYLQPARATWWSDVRSVARRMGLGHALAGPAVALLAVALMLALAGAMTFVTLRDLA